MRVTSKGFTLVEIVSGDRHYWHLGGLAIAAVQAARAKQRGACSAATICKPRAGFA